jgi:poly(hydroxyalkanoate) depolymerase family esterase
MKPYEQFVGKLLQAVRLGQGQGHDPVAATEIVQQALRSAGLLQPSTAVPPFAPGMQGAQDAPAGARPFVDLNAAPAWARQSATADAAPDSGAASAPESAQGYAPGFAANAGAFHGADALRDWAARFVPHMPHMPGQAPHGRGHAPELPGQVVRGSFGAAAGARGYRLYVPARPAEGPRPLVVMLHGCQQDPDDFAAGTKMDALAEEYGCLVLYPEQSRSANGSNCWNWFETPHQGREGGEPSIIAGMTREVMREHGADPARVYVAGLSAGGAMAAILGNAYPDLYAAIGVHSGLPVGSAHDLMSALNAMKRDASAGSKRGTAQAGAVPAIVFHGDQDATVHPSNGHAVLRQFAIGSADVPLRAVEERGQDGAGRAYTRTLMQAGEGRTVAEHWTVHGAGHAWAGGSSAGSYTDPAGPDASSAMLRFFLARPQPRG